MSYYSYDPFVDVPQNNLHMLAGIGASLFAGRVALNAVDYNTNDGSRHVYAPGSITQTKTKMKYQRKKPSRKIATVSTVKRMLHGVMEKKQCAIQLSTSIPNASNDAILTHNLTARIEQGNLDGNRVGDEVYLNSYHLNGVFITDSKAAFYRMRIIIGWSGEEFNPAATTLATGLTSSQVFIQTPTEQITGVINTKAFTPLYDTTIDINSQLDTFRDGRTFRTVVPLNQKFKYQNAAAVYGKTKNLYMLIIATSDTLASATNICSIECTSALKYTDA